MKNNNFDIIVCGAGHAGCEAALAAARLGFKTILITISIEKIALMPCNPSIGGVGKSQLVAEMDALGGQMAKTADETLIQIKILNKSKGPAVQALRAQIDKKQYEQSMKSLVLNTENLFLKQGTVSKIITKNKRVIGIETESGQIFTGSSVIITGGTFLRGRVIIGDKEYKAGRMGEYPSMDLTKSLNEAGIETDRYQTATPPRIDKRTIDFSKTVIQAGENKPLCFSFWNNKKLYKDTPSYLTYTNKKTSEIISSNIEKSPIRSGIINTHGPRHCPSIDRKIINFPQKSRHPVFIEPEGLRTNEMYLQGLTTSMPFKYQQQIVNSVEGLENARIIRPGYAVEYDYVVPKQLNLTFESKIIDNLYFAGQINGTSGYEEAAVQGFLAGVNAALKLKNKDPFILTREESYIGVLIDDLLTKELLEPYRMYTSRAEYRLVNRADNADLRLAGYGYEIGLISKKQYQKVKKKEEIIKIITDFIKNNVVQPGNELNEILRKFDTSIIDRPVSLLNLLKRPEIKLSQLLAEKNNYFNINFPLNYLNEELLNQVEINTKYEGYIVKQMEEIRRCYGIEKINIPVHLNYFDIQGITYEAQEKLSYIKPNTVGQASRIAGVSPADISILMIYLKSKNRLNND